MNSDAILFFVGTLMFLVGLSFGIICKDSDWASDCISIKAHTSSGRAYKCEVDTHYDAANHNT